MKRGFMEGIILFVAVIFLILAMFIYLRRDDTESKIFSEAAKSFKGSINAVESESSKLILEQKNFAANTVTALADLTGRIAKLEQRQSQDVNFNLKEPVNFNVTYKNVLPNPPIKSKTPLLDKAGIRPRLNQ